MTRKRDNAATLLSTTSDAIRVTSRGVGVVTFNGSTSTTPPREMCSSAANTPAANG
jgi:hypothetical protein